MNAMGAHRQWFIKPQEKQIRKQRFLNAFSALFPKSESAILTNAMHPLFS